MEHTIRIIWGINEGRTYQIREGQTLRVGRAAGNDISLESDLTASGNHALIKISQNRLFVKDLHSTNGTLIRGEKIVEGGWHQPQQFFIFGATAFTHEAKRRMATLPLPISEVPPSWKSLELFQSALNYCENQNFLGTLHLFLALHATHNNLVSSFLRRSGTEHELSALNKRLMNCSVFQQPHEWLNKAIEFSNSVQLYHKQITPLAQFFLKDWTMHQDPQIMLERFAQYDFNMTHVFMGWPDRLKTHDLFPAKIANPESISTTQKTDDHELDTVLTYKALWKNVEAVMEKGQLPLITGSTGIGKSYVLRLLNEKTKRALLSEKLRHRPLLIKDPLEFLLYNSPEKLGTFIRELAGMIQFDGLLMIDHMGLLFHLGNQIADDLLELISTFNRRSQPMLLTCSKQHLSLLKEYLPFCTEIDLDEYLKPQLETIHNRMIHDTENELGIMMAKSAREFLKEKIIDKQPNNIRYLQEFLKLSSRRALSLSSQFGAVDAETRAISKIGAMFFESTYKEWCQPISAPPVQPTMVQPVLPPVQPVAPPIESTPQDVSKEVEALLSIEKHMREFSTALIKIPFRYGPISGSFKDPGPISKEQRLDMLVLHFIKMMKSLKGGFQGWFSRFWGPLSPQELRGLHGKKEKALWQAYESLARDVRLERAEQDMREACKENWDKW